MSALSKIHYWFNTATRMLAFGGVRVWMMKDSTSAKAEDPRTRDLIKSIT